jgi:putative transposase
VVTGRETQRVITTALSLALAVTLDGHTELVGMWIAHSEGATFWLSVLTELQNRGVKDVFIACVDGLTGFPEAREAVSPQTRVHWCMVHLVRPSLRSVSHKDRKAGATDLTAISSASTEVEAEFTVERCAEKWDGLSPSISTSWRTHWTRVIPVCAFPEDSRTVMSPTTAIASVTRTLRKVTRTHRLFPSDDAVSKVVSLALLTSAQQWTMPMRDGKPARNRVAVECAERFPR